MPKLLAEVTALNPDVIVAEATPAVAAAQQLTSTIPIVMAPSTDPVGPGFVKSFARPGGNITGVANMFDDTTAKTLDIALFSPTSKRSAYSLPPIPHTRLWPRSPFGPQARLASPPKVSPRQILRT